MPFASVMWASAARSSASATASPLRRSPSMSALITRASMSSVTPGSVATRAPFSLARLRAAVCESDWTVGARTTSAAAIASATVARRLGRVRGALRHHGQDRVRSGAGGLVAQALPHVLGRRVADDEDVLAVLDAEAVPHHRADGSIEVGVRHDVSLCG